jgi:hypothetical protein
VIRLHSNELVSQNLPPALAATLPALPQTQENNALALICSGFTCEPPISDFGTLTSVLADKIRSESLSHGS